MTEANQSRGTTIAIVVGVVALLLGLCLGGLAGGVGGYFIGRGVAPTPRVIERILTAVPPLPTLPATPRQPSTPESPAIPPLTPFRGLPRNLTSGAWVQEVVKGSPAEEAGIQPRDLILKVNNTPVDANHRLADILKQYKPGERVQVTVWRLGDEKTLTVTLGENPNQAGLAYLGIRYVELSPATPTPRPGG